MLLLKTLMVATLAIGTVASAKDKEQKVPVKTAVAIFASGCFWCTESDFQDLPGVISAVSGYIGGKVDKPTYVQVSSGSTGHAESVQVTYDPEKITYNQLLKHFWENSDPTVKDRQFCDIGTQYRTGIFFLTPEQEHIAQASKVTVQKFLKVPVYTEIAKATTFFPAEDYHQDYYQKNPVRYKYYRFNCGRDKRLEKLWEKTPAGETYDSLKF